MAGTVWTSAEATNNPIKWVKTSTTGTAIYVKCPSAYSVDREDISNSNAGRTASGQMVKSQLYVGGKAVRAVALSVEWANLKSADIAGLFTIFEKAQYLYINYYDPATAAFKQEWFYVGNRNVPLYNMAMGIWTALSLKLISRNKSS